MISSRPLRIVLIALLVFGTASALLGAVMGVLFDGAGVPVEYLTGSPFTSYLVPGLILGVVVGGSQAIAALALIRRARSALMASAVAGFGMLIWIFAELAIIGEYSWLQALYFSLGALQVIVVLALLGIAPRVVRADGAG
ncbi:hypothetical protein NY547_14935 [Cnuibacter physcomitrellae]|uniref:hypothetical protein n=1 Tax=Cnuibacter physcomitrellae TaxID=1619308 RepID=UPI0021757C7D|nr:hypothetical protein [Cnuibacter physcomitrellae]MCS5498546.1 hypothetical protein [Cnuibacter physcomitrellae]